MDQQSLAHVGTPPDENPTQPPGDELMGKRNDSKSITRRSTGAGSKIAEIELSTLCGQCLDRRIPSLAQMQREIKAWVVDRNQRQHRDQLAIHDGGCTDQAEEPVSETLSGNRY